MGLGPFGAAIPVFVTTGDHRVADARSAARRACVHTAAFTLSLAVAKFPAGTKAARTATTVRATFLALALLGADGYAFSGDWITGHAVRAVNLRAEIVTKGGGIGDAVAVVVQLITAKLVRARVNASMAVVAVGTVASRAKDPVGVSVADFADGLKATLTRGAVVVCRADAFGIYATAIDTDPAMFALVIAGAAPGFQFAAATTGHPGNRQHE